VAVLEWGMALRMRDHLAVAMAELRFEPTPVRIRAFLDDAPVVDSHRAVLVWEPRRIVPVYAVPLADLTVTTSHSEDQPDTWDLVGAPMVLGPGDFWRHTVAGTSLDLTAGPRRLEGAGFVPHDLADLVVLDFAAFDTWWAEDEPVVGHPRDPFKRIDVLASSHEVTVRLDGVVLASSVRPLVLLETHLPARYYLPAEDVRMDLLESSPTTSTCAYKGVARYLSTRDGSAGGRDVAWVYPDPLDDALRVRDHVCFWAERTDLVVDGAPIERPVTPWSPPT
jgi:uncharacterized protein (DUF427 family)